MATDGMRAIDDGLTGALGPGTVEWPPLGDRARLRAYDRYRRLHDGDHERVYVAEGRYSYDRDREYVTVNICGEITDLIVDRLFGETIELRAATTGTAGATGTAEGAGGTTATTGNGDGNGDDNGDGMAQAGVTGETVTAETAWLQHEAEISQLDTMLVELGRGVSYRGDGALKVRYDSRREDVLISPVSSALLFAETAEGDVKHITRITIAYTRPDPANPKQLLLFQEIHSRGRIDYTLHRIKPNPSGGYRYRPDADRIPLETLPDLAELAATLDANDGQDTGIDELLVVPIAMGGSDESGVWGRSDYADIDAMQGELNNRVTQIAGIQDKHADPWMYGPPMFLNEDQKLDPRYRYLAVDQREQAPGYISWDAQLQHAETAINRLKADMLFTAGLSPESFGLGEGAAESGRALKLRQHRTASAVRMRQRVYDRAIRQALSLASKLANSPVMRDRTVWDGRPIPILEPEQIAIGWNDGLPNDETEAIERGGTGLAMGVMSLERAVRTAQPELTDVEVAAEIDAIRSQTQDKGRVSFSAPAIEPVAPEITNTDSQQGAQVGAQVTQVTRRGASI